MKIKSKLLAVTFLITFMIPMQIAKAEEVQIACGGGGNYTLILPAGVAVSGKSCSGALSVDNRVKIIGANAFSFSKVTSVNLPDSVKSIEASAFSYNSFNSINVGTSLETIGFEAFRMAKFESINLPSTLKVIGECAFCDTYFTSIKLPNSLISIGRNAFTRDDSTTPLKSIEIPDSVTEIGIYAFSNAKLESLILGKSVKQIQAGAFQFNKLKSVLIPGNVSFVGAFAFRGNPLEKVEIQSGVKVIDSEAFSKIKIETLVLPDSVDSIGSRAFAEIPTLKSITFTENFEQYRNSDGALWIGDIFEGSYAITEINYCGKMTGFLVTPICSNAKKAIMNVRVGEKEEIGKLLSSIEALISSLYIDYGYTNVRNQQSMLERLSKAFEVVNYTGYSEIRISAQKIEAELRTLEQALAKDKKALKKVTITCVKGNVTKKVTAVSPKCPTGYKKK